VRGAKIAPELLVWLCAISLLSCDGGTNAGDRMGNQATGASACSACDQELLSCARSVSALASPADVARFVIKCEASHQECALRECQGVPAACATCLAAHTECVLAAAAQSLFDGSPGDIASCNQSGDSCASACQ
jgi:hypothetical protein